MLNSSLKDLNLSSKELKKIAKSLARKRVIKCYKSMPDYKLLFGLEASENEKNSDKTRIEKIREELKKLAHKLSKSEIKEIRKSFYKIKNKKDLPGPRETEIKENFLELENSFLD